MDWSLVVAYGAVPTALTITSVSFLPKNSFLRFAFLPLVALSARYAFLEARKAESLVIVMAFGADAVISTWVYVERVLINNWRFDTQGPSTTQGGQKVFLPSPAEAERLERASAWEKFKFGLWVALNKRFPNSKWQVNGVSAFSSKDPTYIPSKANFLMWRLLTFLIFFLIVDWIDLTSGPEDQAKLLNAVEIGFFSRLNQVSTKEIFYRAAMMAVWGGGVLIQQLQYCFLSAAAVLTGLSEPADWPPLYGHLADSYSIRQFWGNFWHQVLRLNFSSPAHLVVYNVLGLKRGTLLARYLFIGLTFFQSGVMHVVLDMLTYVPPAASGAVVFFTEQALGIMIEDAVQQLYKTAFGSPRSVFARIVTRSIGYVWLVAWFAWSMPLYISTQFREGVPKGHVLPFSVIGTIKPLIS